jgi:hypothetical protein
MAIHLEIELPDRTSCFQLEDELKALYPLAVGRHGVWHVELDDEGDHLDVVVATTRRYLREHHLENAVLHVDGASLEIVP